MSRLTRRVRSDVPPMILKLLNLEEVPTECIEVVGTNSKPCDEVCEENQCSSCVLSAVFEKLAHYEDLEEQGRLVEIIKCSDCDHFDTNGCVEGCGWCDMWNIGRFESGYCDKAKLAELKGE